MRTHMTQMKKVSDILVDVLEHAGVKNCYGIVGDTLNFVTESIHQSSIQWVHMRHEEAGAFAAGAEAFVAERLTACAGSCGPGSIHFINGILEAHRNNAPVILIASQLASENLGIGFPQEVDVASIYKECSVFCQQVNDPKQARRIFTQAAQTAINKKGVAVIVLPVDISQALVEDNPNIRIWSPKPVIRPNDHDLQEIAKLINQGHKIGIFAGIGCKDAHDELIKLAKTLKAPIAHTSRAKDFVEYNNPFNVGMTGMFGNKGAFDMVKSCDTLLLLGCGFAWSQFYPEHARIIQIDIDATQLGLRHPISYGAVGEIKDTLEALIPYLDPREDRNFLDQHLIEHEKATLKLDERASIEHKGPIHPQYLIQLIDQYADHDAMFTADVGSAMLWMSRHIHVNGSRRTLTSLKHGTMANAMPQALGLQKAFPERQVISISGDGGLTMLLGDLLTAHQEKLPIKIFVLNNGALDFVELEQKGEGLVNRYTDLHNGDLEMVARGMGFYADTVEHGEDLAEAVKTCLSVEGPALLSVKTSPNELIVPPNINFNNVTGMALYSAKAVLEGRSSEVLKFFKDNT